MKAQEKGVLPGSELFFHTPTETARNMFFYTVCCGIFKCTGGYRVERKTYHSFLLLFAAKGSGYITRNGVKTAVPEGTLALIDCYEPHSYGTDTSWTILWCHFDGKDARAWYMLIARSGSFSVMSPSPEHVLMIMETMLAGFRNNSGTTEALHNSLIVQLLTELLYRGPEKAVAATGFDSLLSYIDNHISEDMSVEQMARHVCLSPFHFIRTFKAHTGYTPHEYLVHARINAAKFYLHTAQKSVKEITFLCGFSSESSFSNCFKHICGISPAEYRAGKTSGKNSYD